MVERVEWHREREEIKRMRLSAIKDAERFLAHNRVPYHLARSVKACIEAHRAALKEMGRADERDG